MSTLLEKIGLSNKQEPTGNPELSIADLFQTLASKSVPDSRSTCLLDANQDHGAPSNTLDLLDKLRAATQFKNPISDYVEDHCKPGSKGLSRAQIALVLAYVQFRSAPTKIEIASLLAQIIRLSLDQDPIISVARNLSDELLGKQDHSTLLHQGVSTFAQRLNVPFLGPATLSFVELLLMDRRQRKNQGIPNIYDNFFNLFTALKESYPDDLIFKVRPALFNATLERFILGRTEIIIGFLHLLPPDADIYKRVSIDECTKDLKEEDPFVTLCSGLIRLAIRESSSAGKDGVVGIYQSLVTPYAGLFSKGSFRLVNAWVSAHIGESGVEDDHKHDAIHHAISFIRQTPLRKEDLDIILQRELRLVEARNQQADQFLNRIKGVSNESMGENAFILPNPHQKRGFLEALTHLAPW